jgi:predicted nuclease with TOPRIM domain
MSGPGYEELIILSRKVEELIGRYNNLKRENDELKGKNEELRRIIEERNERLKDLETKYELVKLSGAVLGGGDNAQEAKRKITDLVREIDKCVALLNR